MGQGTTREIMVYTDEASIYSIGEEVKVSAKQSLGVMAVLLCYVVPLIVLVAVLAVAVSLGITEGVAALISLIITAAYYAILALMKDKISRRVTFTISKI
jgi:sigma-E factor negative regulatory protein RseC